MFGLTLTLVWCACATVVGWSILAPRLQPLDPAERIGVSGLVGLGGVGWLVFFAGLVPGGLKWLPWVAWGALVAAGAILSWSKRGPIRGNLRTPLFSITLTLLTLIPIVNALAPSDGMDWDTLAYHLAVPKLWLQAGQIEFIPFIHHSNFPFVVDNLYVLGLGWGGESGAKAFTVAFFVLGQIAIFGLARRWFGGQAGWWAALCFVGVPVVLWESGSGYIDVAHGLYAGLCVLYGASFAASRLRGEQASWAILWLSAAMGGFACASKYTGLQTMGVVALVVFVALALRRRTTPGAKSSLKTAFGAALAIVVVGVGLASPWLIRNVANTGNPVYPFFYERLGGRNWDAWRAAIYRDEQQTFGVGRTEAGRDPGALAHGILGLAYQPGRFVNPGQTEGNGFPMGAVGATGLLGFLAWLTSGRKDVRVGLTLASIGLMFVAWFFLSQQSRYATSMTIPGCVLVGGAVVLLKTGWLVRVAVALQAAYAGAMLYAVQTASQLPVVLGTVSRDDYLTQREPFFEESKRINEAVKGGMVALYDQVFGYYLDVPYFWANPGHCTLIPYESLPDAESYIAALKKLGITHVFLDLRYQPDDLKVLFTQSLLHTLNSFPFEEGRRRQMSADPNLKWKLLLIDAMTQDRLEKVSISRRGILARIKD